MKNDIRYQTVKSVWTAGDLNDFMHIFKIVPRSVVSSDLGVNYGRFSKKLKEPELLTFSEIKRISVLTKIDIAYIADLIIALIETDPEKKTFKVQSKATSAEKELLAS